MAFSTGFSHLDSIIGPLHPGDNVIWRLDDTAMYAPFAEAFAEQALAQDMRVIYFRYALNQRPILEERPGLTIVHTDPENSFESFITEIHTIISAQDRKCCFIFDCLSSLSESCYSDRMIGNFFKLTCPFLYEKGTPAYFSLKRYFHSYHTNQPLVETVQYFIDVYRYNGKIYIKPAKLPRPSLQGKVGLFMMDEEKFYPVTDSATISEVISTTPWLGLPSASYRMIGVWDKTFMRAESVLESYEKGQVAPEVMNKTFRELLRLVISRDSRILELAEKHFTLKRVIDIWKRMIGTGLIGGKSVGMLIARSILEDSSPEWIPLLEDHDSFFIASDVFYTFLVINDCWHDRQKQKYPETFLDGNDDVQKRILKGSFPEYIVQRFSDMLDYYGHAPIIVRSSSLLEDNFGNAFAGKYDSIFCANQGTKEERLEYFLNAVRLIYASTMSINALTYRKMRGVLDSDEQMALLVQRVSGSPYGEYYFPQLAGVGFSFNPYAWSKEIDPRAGMMRLVFGLGTRAVDRADDDYTRVVALNVPEKRPEADFNEVKRYAQRRVDVLNLTTNSFTNINFADLKKQFGNMPINLFATRDRELERIARERGMNSISTQVLTFDNLFRQTDFIDRMREMLTTVRDAYETEVDIEFTANFPPEGGFRINLVQCRPFQIQEAAEKVEELPELKNEEILIQAYGAVIGHSRSIGIERIIYVEPRKYGMLNEKERYALAKIIGQVTHLDNDTQPRTMIIGPGRWGTSTPALGIPVAFREIESVHVLFEIDSMHEGLIPDLSLGTHFFNEMVELNMLYVAFFVGREGNLMNLENSMLTQNRLPELLPESASWADTLFVLEPKKGSSPESPRMILNANSLEQRCVLYIQ